jgi:hypothetical protein
MTWTQEDRAVVRQCALAVFVLVAVVLILLVLWPRAAKASWFEAPCILHVPSGPYTYDTATTLYDEALRHEGDGADIQSLSKEDYIHAAEDVYACAP